MSTRTFTYSGTGDHLASSAKNWDTAPIDGDAIVIHTGSACAWDLDASSGITWPTGIAGIVIEGGATPASLYFNTSGTANYIKMKAATTISGTNVSGNNGRLIANSDGAWATTAAYPAAATATIDFTLGGNAYIDLTHLDTNIRCAVPAHPVILLTLDTVAADTTLQVDTDVSTEWPSNSTVVISDSRGAQTFATRVLTTGGDATHIVLTAQINAVYHGTTGEKARIALANRNVIIIGAAGSSQSCIVNGTRGTIGAWMYCATAGQGYAFYNCTELTVLSGFYGPGPTTGWTAGWARVCFNCTITISGNPTFSGNSSGCNSCTVTISGNPTFSGNSYGCNSCTITISGNPTFSGNSSGCFICSLMVSGGSFADTYALRRCPYGNLYNVTITGTENYEYDSAWVPDNSFVSWRGVDGVATAEKDWSPGGITVTDATTPPSGFTQVYKLTCASGSASREGFRQTERTLAYGEVLSVHAQIKIADDHTAYPPRIEIIDPFIDPLIIGGTSGILATSSVAQPNGTIDGGWQAVAVSWTNSGTLPRKILLRVSAKRASGDVYMVLKPYDVPSVSNVLSTATVDWVAGTLTLPVATDVWHTASAYGVGGNGSTPSKVGSSLANLTAANLASGISVDDVGPGTFTHTADYTAISGVVGPTYVLTGHSNYSGGSAGSLTIPIVGDVRTGIAYGVGGTGSTGTLIASTPDGRNRYGF